MVYLSSASFATIPAPPVAGHDRPDPTTGDNRALNVVITGIPEDRSYRSLEWIETVLSCAAGHDVQTSNAFRVGGKFASVKTQPILVKLRIDGLS